MTILLTGATGMVGEGVLHECALHPSIKKIIVLGRKPSGYLHTKVQDILVPSFLELDAVKDQFVNIDACFFCAGVSSVGKTQQEFYALTYTTTMHVAHLLLLQNPALQFCYISGAGTSTSQNAKSSWANTKGKTENDLAKMNFKAEYNFRPGVLIPTKGLKNTLSYYKYFGFLSGVLKVVASNYITTLAQLGQAMIAAVLNGYSKNVCEVSDIKILSALQKNDSLE
jgi:nucleoside-diphosphate-sugar epimerase